MPNPFDLFSKELLNKEWQFGEFSGKGDPFTIPERLIALDHGKTQRLVNGMLLKYSLLLHYLPSGATVLDACCGTGFGAKYLSLNGFNVKGFDSQSPEETFASVRGIEILQRNIFQELIPKLGKFDGICLVDAIEHFQKDSQLEALKVLVQQLNPDGVLLVDTPLVATSHRQSNKHPWVLNWEDLESLIRASGKFKKVDRFVISTFEEKIPVLQKLSKKPKVIHENADQIIVASLPKD